MQVYLLIAAGGILVIGYACYLVWMGLLKVTEGVSDGVKAISTRKAERRARIDQEKALAFASAEQAQIEAYRSQNPVRIIGIPNADAFRRAFQILDEFTRSANAFRPQFTGNLDPRFRTHKFPTHLFELARSHPDSLPEKEPEKITLTADDLSMSGGLEMLKFYRSANVPCKFPYDPPYCELDASAAPTFPSVKTPSRTVVKLVSRDNAEMDDHTDFIRKAYQSEFAKAAALNSQAAILHDEFEQKHSAASDALDFMKIYLGNLNLKLREAEAALASEYQQAKSIFELDCERATRPIRNTHARYVERSPEGIKSHFILTLCNLSLPLPSDYQWDVFYGSDERLLQINQCVPSIADVTVKRTDSNRPSAKRDSDAVLRRYVPAIALQIAHHVVSNDLNADVDRIAINCWSRFFEPSSGRLKDAFVAALTVRKEEISDLNLQRADALEAFRALKGAYVYSVQDVVPIEPIIRLDKNDDRFVAGRDVLDGMAQGQNLAAMDWQDFEHLIRELLSKEYADKNAEVKITRASRDRGVDAIVFNSDPLHGGKFVVQAKRYSNTVDVAAVRELYGTVLSEGANRGILVTTSHYGRDAYEWAANKPLTLVDGPNLLALLSKHGYKFKIESVAP
jgi:restriction system protein